MAKTIVDENNPLIQQHIINLLNLDYLPDTQKAVLLDKMVEVINQRVFLRMLEDLNEEQKKKFEELLENGNDEDLQTFIQVNVPDFLAMLAEETIILKEELVEKMNGEKTKN